MLIITLSIIAWFIFSLMEGYTESYYWHYKLHSGDDQKLKGFDIHPYFSFQRGSVLLLTFFVFLCNFSFGESSLLLLSNMLIFIFLHDGFYYYMRNRISKELNPDDPSKWVYPKKWFDQSKNSTSWMTKYNTPTVRVLFFVIGLGFYIRTIIMNI